MLRTSSSRNHLFLRCYVIVPTLQLKSNGKGSGGRGGEIQGPDLGWNQENGSPWVKHM